MAQPKERTGKSRGARDAAHADVSRTEGRESREKVDPIRDDEGDSITMAEREALLRDEYLQNQLPNPPKRRGIHWLWASTTNQYTPVSWYKKLGYRVVRADELPEFADASMRQSNGEYAGCIGCNEMILMKVSEAGYQQIMKAIHHDRPMDEQGRIRSAIDGLKDRAGTDKEGTALVQEVGEGFKELERMAKRPRQFE